MKVILLQDIAKVGKKYEIKNVADGFALNSLIPTKKAKIATAQAIKELETLKEKVEIELKNKETLLEEDLKMLNETTINITAKTNEEGHLFAGIDKEQIVSALKDQKSIDIDSNSIILEKPIKEAGEHEIEIKVGESNGKFKLNVTKED